jgi:hypothetical protein
MLGEARDWSNPLSPSPRIDLYLSWGGEGVVRGGFASVGLMGGRNLFGTGVGRFKFGKPDEGMNITPSSDALIFLGKFFEVSFSSDLAFGKLPHETFKTCFGFVFKFGFGAIGLVFGVNTKAAHIQQVKNNASTISVIIYD